MRVELIPKWMRSKQRLIVFLVSLVSFLATIRKAVRYFARKLTKKTKKTINLFLDLIHFGMSSTLISFDSEYYKYHGGERE